MARRGIGETGSTEGALMTGLPGIATTGWPTGRRGIVLVGGGATGTAVEGSGVL